MSALPNWITVHPDRRISYYPSGVRGQGPRKQQRGGRTMLEAVNTAKRIVNEVTVGASLAISDDATWITLLTAWERAHVGTLREGTYRRRMSAINAHILPAIGNVKIVSTDAATLNAVIDHVVESGSGPDNFDSVAQTLNVVATWAETRKYLVSNCFGNEKMTRMAFQLGRKRCIPQMTINPDEGPALTLEDCPTWDDVIELSKEVANIIAGRTSDAALGELYGCAVRVMAGSGLRLAEMLGVTADRVNFNHGTIKVDRQLDRYIPWKTGDTMPTAPTKNSVTRHARVWEKVKDDLKQLLDATDENGPIVPPFNGITRWADAWGRILSEAAQRVSWEWAPHYLRHHYGSYSMADRSDGGMGMHFTKVQASMGHASPEVTLRTYTHKVSSTDDGWVS